MSKALEACSMTTSTDMLLIYEATILEFKRCVELSKFNHEQDTTKDEFCFLNKRDKKIEASL